MPAGCTCDACRVHRAPVIRAGERTNLPVSARHTADCVLLSPLCLGPQPGQQPLLPRIGAPQAASCGAE